MEPFTLPELSAKLFVSAFLLLAGSYLACYFVLRRIISWFNREAMYDLPDDRKLHKKATPSMGGIGMFIAAIVPFLFYSGVHFREYPLILSLTAGATVLFTVGYLDDRLNLSAAFRFLIQFAVAGFILYQGLLLTHFPGIDWLNHLHPLMYWVLGIIIIAGATNAANLIDGVDGLAGNLFRTNFIVLAILFILLGNYGLAALTLVLIGATSGFLSLNRHPARIFMGDTGSLFAGFLSIALSLYAIRAVDPEYLNLVPLVLGLHFLTGLDMLRVFLQRMAHKRSPFAADRNHIHHYALRADLGAEQVNKLLHAKHLLFIGTGLAFSESVYLSFALMALFYALTLFGLWYRQRRLAFNSERETELGRLFREYSW